MAVYFTKQAINTVTHKYIHVTEALTLTCGYIMTLPYVKRKQLTNIMSERWCIALIIKLKQVLKQFSKFPKG